MRKIINITVSCLLISIMVFCGINIYKEYKEYKIGEEIYNEIAKKMIYEVNHQTYKSSEENFVDVTQSVNETEQFLNVDWISLKTVNEDIIGWIYCENTELNYPILKSKDNEEYVNLTVTKKRNSAGSIFLDCRNNSEFSDYNSILYGHNMKNGSMFKTVNRYKKEDYYKEHPIIHIYMEDMKKKYNVVSVFATDIYDRVYNIKLETQEEYSQWIQEMKKKSIYKTNIEISDKKRTITLSTCNGPTGSSKRFIVLIQEI